MRRIDQLGGGRVPFCRGNILWCWTHCRQLVPLGARPRRSCPRLCIDLYDATCADELPSAQNFYNELKPVVGFIVAGELATTVKVGQQLLGARVGDPRRPLPPLGDGSRAALQKLLMYV
jgi:4-hydroxy-tetrahydrodipicolinate synthase